MSQRPDDTRAKLTEALSQVERGWALLPVQRRGKPPASNLIRRTRGHYEWGPLGRRPAGADEVAAWLELDPETNLGVITGEASGLVVVDIDDEVRAPELPTTASVRTGRGRHLYYATTEPVASRDYVWGSLRGERCYAVTPRSEHAHGPYRWEGNSERALENFENLARESLRDFIRTTVRQAREDEASQACLGSCLYVLTRPRRLCGAAGGLADLERDEAVAMRLAAALGLPEGLRIGESFPCLLHRDRKPSAALWRAQEGAHVLYHDFHGASHGERTWLTFAQVRARLAGRTGPLGAPELSVWKLRLAAEAGLLAPLALELETVPPAQLRRVWGGFVYLLALRWRTGPGEPAPFSARFASAWCGVSKREAHEAVRELARLGLLQPAGFAPQRTRLWLPKGVRPID